MNLNEIENYFVYTDSRGVITAQDAVHPVTGKGLYSGKTLDEYRAEYPDMRVMCWDEYIVQHEACFKSAPKEITEEQFFYALEVLPPDNWVRGDDCESFKMCERTTGSITGIYARIGRKFFQMYDSYRMKHAAIIAACRAA